MARHRSAGIGGGVEGGVEGGFGSFGSPLDGVDWRSCVVAAENEAARIKCSRGWIAGELWWSSLLPLLTVP